MNRDYSRFDSLTSILAGTVDEKVQKGDRTLFTVQRAIAEYVKTHTFQQSQ